MGTIPTKDWLTIKTEEYKDDPQYIFECAFLAFEEELAKNQISLPPEFAELIEEHFWELFEGVE